MSNNLEFDCFLDDCSTKKKKKLLQMCFCRECSEILSKVVADFILTNQTGTKVNIANWQE